MVILNLRLHGVLRIITPSVQSKNSGKEARESIININFHATNSKQINNIAKKKK